MAWLAPEQVGRPNGGQDADGVGPAPRIAANARAMTKLDLENETLRAVLGGNALRVYRVLTSPS